MPRRAFLFFALSLLIFIRADLVSAESIYSFDVEINVSQDSSFLVKEKILYNFGNLQKHGIIRSIPLTDVGSVKVVGVVDGSSNVSRYETSKKGGYLKIKIGDPDKTITGSRLYTISYEVKDGLRFFKDHDELYWNVTGNEWPVPISAAQIAIRLPGSVSDDDLEFDCYTGSLGSKEKSCVWQRDNNGKIVFRSFRQLNLSEGLTVVLGWPKDIVKRPLLPFWIKQNWPMGLPILIFIFLFFYWWQRGRDFPVKKPIMALYEPPQGLKPAYVGAILRQKVGPLEVCATIIDLAVRGYLKIREIEKTGIAGLFGKNDYEIIRVKDLQQASDLSEYEYDLLKTIRLLEDSDGSAVKLAQLKLNIAHFNKPILAGLTRDGYFVSNPEKIKRNFAMMGAIFFGIAWLLAAPLNIYFTKYALLIGMLFFSGAISFLFSLIMPKRSKKGAEAYWQILGFKEYINKAEKYRLQFAEKENLFEKYLPYAIVFGSVNKWAAAFEGIYKNPPSWYEGRYPGSFSTLVFASSFNHAVSSMNQVFSGRGGGRSSGFGGGGFSGGGGGGGGGGSW